MKKIAVLLICFMLLLVGCSNDAPEKTPVKTPVKTAETTQQKEDNSLLPEFPESNIYVNENRGYTLTFPESWKGHYYLKEGYDDSVGVYFYGKSKYSNGDGVLLYEFENIAYAPYDADIIKTVKAKTNHGNNYLYNFLHYSKNTNRFANPEKYTEDEEQIKLMKEDYKQIKSMNVNDIGFSSEVIEYPSLPKFPESNEYINEKHGYKLTFPDSWKGYYYIDESDADLPEIYFYGKSYFGRCFPFTYTEKFGCDMFAVVTKQFIDDPSSIYDNERKVGNVGETQYYYATLRKDAHIEMFMYPEKYISDAEEIALALEDFKQLEAMDMNDVVFTPLR